MRRFLVVGCGGSGGLTLQYVMDQLRADLRPFGISELPPGWQFVHIDVPVSPDNVGPGKPPAVPAEGYLSIGSARGRFVDAAEKVNRRLLSGPGLGGLVTWAPYPPAVSVPTSEGAGQFRAVGRVLTLTRFGDIRNQLQAAWQRVETGSARTLTREAARVLSPQTVEDVEDPPYALVVASMAGGTGASMAIDVCRILASVGPRPDMIAMVVHTPEVFDGLADTQRAGVDANAAAMIGELIALQSGAGIRDDQDLMRDLGAALATGAAVPFRRVIPVGARIGTTGEKLGDSPDDRCRGLGRAIAALMADGTAWESFKKNAMENFGGGQNVDRSVVGWGVDPDQVVWGSLGYASVDLGRARYAEYAAQRVARAAVDRLAVGYFRPTDDRPATAQLNALVEQTLWPRLVAATGMPENRDAVPHWLVSKVLANRVETDSRELVEQARHSLPPGQRKAGDMLRHVLNAAAQNEPGWRSRVEELAYAAVWNWTRTVRADLLELVRDVTAQFGLAAARELVVTWEQRCGWLASVLQAGANATRPATLAEADPQLTERLAAERGQVSAESGLVTRLLDSVAERIYKAMLAETGRKLALVLPQLREGWSRPLVAALSERLDEIELERAASARHAGQAETQTDSYAAWPDHGTVPERFGGAPNEVLLTEAAEYPGLFENHLVDTISAGGTTSVAVDDALPQVTGAVLLGRWQSTGSLQVDETCVQERAEWRAQELPFDVAPDGTRSAWRQPPATAQFRVTLSPSEVLRRARVYLDRPNEPFARFVHVSLDEFLNDPSLRDQERDRRSEQLVNAVRTALDKAQPMVSVDPVRAAWMHHQELKLYFTFSALPVGNSRAAGLLPGLLESRGDVLQQSLESLRRAVVAGAGSRATRIDIYGSFPNLSPVVFTSLLEPVVRRWALCSDDAARAQFWQYKRSRRLPGALPIGDAARQAMITGWFVGRLFGLLRYPEEAANQGFAVYDPEAGTWVSLPAPMPPAGGRSGQAAPSRGLDRMAAVLEAMPIRLAECATAASDDPLEPVRCFRLLRQLGDDGLHDPNGSSAIALRAATEWVEHGRTLSGAVPAQSGPPDGTPDQRRQVLQDYLTTLAASFRTDYLPPDGTGGGPAGKWSKIDSLDKAMATPRFHELAADALRSVELLQGLVAGGPDDEDGPDV